MQDKSIKQNSFQGISVVFSDRSLIVIIKLIDNKPSRT